ncbi:ATP-binding cassette domain-containing protein [Chryseosolibacter indicus]|uniref:ATP-binding cassette domain-containing protein n=1 Tax=Chryseosolibacter indicus TaxID=2782351 RepID=A0ABS5VV06_9BACT|nr:ATP-binding cassette domain-containing protein [Chryseosolibacter indicus]MBT1704699.1 ATP-binding cassette domain-containing protein [Chryseosolibacter indicus]
MSEALLKAILRLFAQVAREGGVTKQEREQISFFLHEHLSKPAVDNYLHQFDEYIKTLADTHVDENTIRKLCQEINAQLTQKQKVVIILELITIIQADGNISAHEDHLMKVIGETFKVNEEEIDAIEVFVLGNKAEQLDHPDILIIDSLLTSNFSKAKHIVRTHLYGFISVLHVKQNDLYFIKYLGATDVFLNGVPVKPGRISVLAVGSLLRWDKDEPVYYGSILKQFVNFASLNRISFEAKNISFKFKNGKLGLRDVNLATESGNLIALMGASGAGKSTLLHVLNGSEKPSEGQVLINGIDIHKNPERIEGVIGFVPQDDLLIEDLTVYQNLYYAARLCFSHKSEAEIDGLVMTVLEDLGLAESKDLKVGSPLHKTISGGQRKRLNIGLELLREPAVLFCDEPTSGLSSRDSENIIDLLKELSLKGKLVFAVIHQPSSDIFKMFDKLVILDTGGYQIYYGNPVDAIVYFKRTINMINSEEGECHECGNVNPEQIFNIIESKVINEYGHFTNERKISAQQWNESYLKYHRPITIKPSDDVPHSTLNIPTRLKQTRLFSLRDIQAKIHNTQYMVINLLEAPVLAFILAFIVRYYNVDDKHLTGYLFGKNLNIPAYLFMSVIVALFMGLTVSAEEIIRDRKILKREAFLHLSRSSYILSKISILFMLSAIQTFMFVLVGNYILEIEGLFLEHWLILFTTSCFANLLGLNISSGFNSAVTIYILIPLLLIPQLILSGVVVKFDKLNPTIGNTATVPFVGDLMASRWAFEAAMVTQFKDNRFGEEFYKYDKAMANADFQKVYLIPELETRLQYCLQSYKSKDDADRAKVATDLQLIQAEVVKELEVVGQDKYKGVSDLTVTKFDSTVYENLSAFLNQLKQFYMKRYNAADQVKEKRIQELTSTVEKEKAFEKLRESYHNDAVAELVKNLTETHRIIESDGRLVQKIYPIYKDPDPEHMVDFDAQFYMPSKHFLNTRVDTLFFNTGVIWSMTFVLALTLYFDVLRRIIDGIGNLSNPIYRRK